ncbi:LOW QUALITY PROTEIN: hypothetical protein V2J09_019068 [Rumex salicifolius]
MATPFTLLCSNRYPLGSGFRVSSGFSAGHFNKQVVGRVQFSLSPRNSIVALSIRSTQESLLQYSVSQSTKLRGSRGYLQPINCALSGNATSGSENPAIATITGSFESVKTSLSQLTPIDVCKWCGIIAVAIATSKWFVNLILSPFFWVYFSWAWMFWPWSVAIAVGAYGIHCFRKFYNGEATVLEQFALVTSTFTWLTLVPPAFFNGYIDGWPIAFFFIYHYFVFFNATVRKRMYGDTCLRPHDSKWDVKVPALYRLLFCIGVTIGHWLAAFEGPELIRLAGGWYNGFVWGLILITLFMQYHATFYLAKYSDKVVVPSVVVQFGPFRWVRHPIYASTMLLFVSYFAALQAPISALFMAAVCVLYYNQKAVLEEAVLLGEFGENYVEYTKKVPYKFIPFLIYAKAYVLLDSSIRVTQMKIYIRSRDYAYEAPKRSLILLRKKVAVAGKEPCQWASTFTQPIILCYDGPWTDR